MADDEKREEVDDGLAAHYVRGLQNSSRHNAAAYGFSIAATASFGVLTKIHGEPSVLDCFVYVLGASAGFALVNAVSSKGYRERIPEEPPVVILLGTSFSVMSICASVASAVGIGYALHGWVAWIVASFAFTLCYLLATALELGVAGRLHSHGGVEGERSRANAEEEEAA